MTPPAGLLDKGSAVEEWIDLRFFRPAGLWLVRKLAPTRVTADQLTVVALLIGLLAGHLFFYPSVGLNALGLGLFLLSDVFDSADGQLARLRNSSTRFGAVLDGISDNLRFLNLYVHLLLRILVAHALPLPLALALILVAGASHGLQACIVDFLRQVYLLVTTGAARLDLPEDIATASAPSLGGRLILALYRPYVARQARWCPSSTAVVRAIRQGNASPWLAEAWARMQARPVARCALFAQNIRFLLLALTALVGWPQGFFWLTLGPLNLALAWVLLTHERGAARLARVPVAAAGLVPAGGAGSWCSAVCCSDWAAWRARLTCPAFCAGPGSPTGCGSSRRWTTGIPRPASRGSPTSRTAGSRPNPRRSISWTSVRPPRVISSWCCGRWSRATTCSAKSPSP